VKQHARFLHGWGVVCGLTVIAAPQPGAPWTIRVCPGYAIGPCGDEIEVHAAVLLDIRQFFWSRPYVGGVGARLAFVGLRPAIPDGGQGCGCHTCDPDPATRLPDGYVIEILWQYEFAGGAVDLCTTIVAPCPTVPPILDVVLALVALPDSESTPLTNADIR
jgi:hypothetical protein